jgi:hypothetical protein
MLTLIGQNTGVRILVAWPSETIFTVRPNTCDCDSTTCYFRAPKINAQCGGRTLCDGTLPTAPQRFAFPVVSRDDGHTFEL